MRAAYLSGPMTGLPYFNYPAFHTAAAELRARGWRVFNPAEMFADADPFPLREAFAEYCRIICLEVDAVVVLPGWGKSAGARVEVSLARRCEVDVIPLMHALAGSVKESPNDR